MMKLNLFFVVLIGIGLGACKKDFKKTESGLNYKIYTDNKGPKPKLGDFLTMHMLYKTESDSVIFDSRNQGAPIRIPLYEPSFEGGIEEGFALLSAGDSATFIVSSDSLFEKTFRQPLPAFLKKGSKIVFDVKLDKIQTSQEIENEQQAYMDEKMKEEKYTIERYLKDNKLSVQPTASGLYYISNLKGKGTEADSGKIVGVQYVGKFLDGRVFDSSLESGKPFEFQLGRGEVVTGWEEGIEMMRVGDKATLLVPSHLAYGERGAGNVIPPYSPLLFEVELISVK